VSLAALLFVAAFAIRLAGAAASGTLTRHPANYNLTLGSTVALHEPRAGFFPRGDFYATSLLYALSARKEPVLGILFCLVGAALPLVVARLAKELLPEAAHRAAWIAGALAALFPPLVFLSTTWRYMLFPVLFGLLHALLVLATARTPRRWAIRTAAGGAALLLTRPDYYGGGALLALGATRWSRGARVAAVLAPVLLASIHNMLVVGRVSPTPSNFWYNLDAGNNPRTRDATIGYGPERWAPELTLEGGVALHGDDVHRGRVGRFLADQPTLVLEGIVMKAARVLDARRDGALSQGPLENAGYTAAVLAAALGAAVGMALLAAGSGRALTQRPLLLLGGLALPMVVFFSLDRTRVLIQAVWLVYAACALARLRREPVSS
jgi:hypothetical protein